MARWTILSSRAATASGRCRPSGLGMYTRRDGNARYAPLCTRSCRFARFLSRSASKVPHVSPSTPGAAFRFNSLNASRSRSVLMWWSSAVNLSFFLCLAACRMRSSACDTLARSCARYVLCRLAFPLVPVLGSASSAADCSALFVGFSGLGFFVAQWLAYALPCRRFTAALADDSARLGADVVRYSFIVMDLHHLLLAGLPAHTKQYQQRQAQAAFWNTSAVISSGTGAMPSARQAGTIGRGLTGQPCAVAIRKCLTRP